MKEIQTELSLKEKIDRARDGRTQTWLISKMRQQGIKIDDVLFSRKKHGFLPFKPEEIKVIEKILKVKL